MNEERFRKKFERKDENGDRRGINTGSINLLIDFVNNSNNKCKDDDVKFFLNNIDEIDKIRPYFVIFYSDSDSGIVGGYQFYFSSLTLNRSVDNLIIGHEMGHILNGIKNIIVPDPKRPHCEVLLPDNFSEIITRAKENSLALNNREELKAYIERLCKSQDISDAESGPVSDIFSAVFQAPYVFVGSKDNKCTFPKSHTVYYNVEKCDEDTRLQARFDETFANIFTLIANGCEEELAMLTRFFGEEFMGLFVEEIHQSVQSYKNGIGYADPQQSSKTTEEEEYTL